MVLDRVLVVIVIDCHHFHGVPDHCASHGDGDVCDVCVLSMQGMWFPWITFLENESDL